MLVIHTEYNIIQLCIEQIPPLTYFPCKFKPAPNHEPLNTKRKRIFEQNKELIILSEINAGT